MATRKQNEKEFRNWADLSGGGRRYWKERRGKVRGFQRIIKIVDADENTVQVLQEIYSESGELVEWHQKFPEDTGHQIIKTPEDELGGDK